MGGFRPGRCLVGSAFVLALVGTACSGADDAADGEDAGPFEERQASESSDDPSAHAVLASRDMIIALNHERAAAAVGILGAETTVLLPAGNAESRRLTDEALASFQSTVADLADEVGSPYRSALDAAGGLGSLRGEIDSHPGPASLSEIDYAEGIFDRYGMLIDLLIEADSTVAHSIDDPDLRRGIDLFTIGLQQSELTERAVRAVLLGTISGRLATPAQISEVAGLHGALVEGQASVSTTAAGSDFAPAADRLEADLDAAGFLDTLSALLETGQADVAAVVDSVNVSADHGWSGFLDRVEEIVADNIA
jgi:Nitrate and nitrite sensing